MSAVITLFEGYRNFSDKELLVSKNPNESVFQTELLIGGIEIIENISAEWTALCEEGASNEPFFRPEWFTAFVRNFENKILILTVRRGGKLRAVLPLVMKNAALHGIPVRKLQAVSNLQTQRFDLIHGADETERQETVKAVWNQIKMLPKWHVLEMRLVKKDSWLNDLLEVAEKENYRTGIWKMDSAPYVTLPQGEEKEQLFEEYFKGLKKTFQQRLKRNLRQLKEQGKVEFVVTRGYSSELMQKYFDLESRGWKGRRGTAAACDPNVTKLHDDFAREVAEKNALLTYELKLDAKTIAMSINTLNNQQTVFWKTSFDEEYKRFSPGLLIFREFLADAIRNDSTELDMLCPANDYKKIWATGEREHVAFYVFQKGILGSLFWKWKFSAVSYLRKFKNKS